MKPNGNGNGHHKTGTGGTGIGVTANDPAATGLNPADADFLLFDAQGKDAPATEAASNKKSNRRRRIITGAILMMLLAVSVAVAIYFMLGGNKTPVNLKVRDTRAQDGKTQTKPQNPDDVTSQAIAEVRSATPEASPTVSAPPNVTTEGARATPATPVTVPIDGLGGTVNQPVPNSTGTTTGQPVKDTTSTGADTTGTSGATNTSTSTQSRRNPEHSIRCALPVAASTASLPNLDAARNPPRLIDKEAPLTSKQMGQGVVLPSFGSMLPVRSLGVLYTLRSGSLARFELTRDVRGQGWAMKKGTVIVGVNRGSEYDRAYMAVVGFIDPESGRLVKLTGDVLGGDGGAGIRGRRRSLSSAWSRAFTRIGASAVNIAGAVASGIGRSSVVVSDAYGYRVTNPVTSEISGLISERNNQRGFVEVPAGTQGYVMVTDLPAEVRGMDALGELSAKDLSERADTNNQRASTGLSERELADLLSSGSPEQIRAALPRMTPEMRRVAEAVIAESGN
jgi:hypothetical protein